MNKRIFISIFVVFTLLSFNIISANDLNESQELQINDMQTISIQNSGDLSPSNELDDANDSGAYLILDNDADIENIYIGDLVTWIVTVENLGPDIAKNTKVYDELPDGLEYLYHNSTNGVFNPDTDIWDIEDLKVEDGLVSLFITCKAVSVGEKVNKVRITSDTKNLNNETFEEEEIDVFDYEHGYKDYDNKIASPILKSVGNPIFLIIMCLFLIFTNFAIKR